MNWPVALFGGVIVVVAGGWIAYERSRPTARSIALVATLSALAALGRLAFAAFTEVKPITAMTFVVGYSLGPIPGFTVGATGMLVSNMLFGQGPYTPWQMAGWGLVGLVGAAVGRLTRRRLGRVWLGVCCAAAAVMAKEVMDLYTWTIGAAHTASAFALVQVSAWPFDAADVASTLLFGLAFGPQLARMLARVTARTTVHWEKAGTVGLVLLAGVAIAAARPPTATAAAGNSRGQAIAKAYAYLASAQASDGGWGVRRGSEGTAMFTTWAMIGLAAEGRPPLTVRRDGRSPIDALRGWAPGLKDAADVERTILALHAAGLPAGSLDGRNLTSQLLGTRRANGSFEGLVNITAFAIFALRADGRGRSDPVVRAAGGWLAKEQNRDGSFSFETRGAVGDVDDTAVAIQGILDADVKDSRGVGRAVAYIARAQDRDGGFPQEPGGSSNAQSTAWAIQGLVAAGKLGWLTASTGHSPIAYLEGLVAPDGSVEYARGEAQTPVWVTAEALAALAEKPFPVAPPRSPVSKSAGRIERSETAGSRQQPKAAGGSQQPKAAGGSQQPRMAGGIERLDRIARALGALLGAALQTVAA